jgi:hypothetical protein
LTEGVGETKGDYGRRGEEGKEKQRFKRSRDSREVDLPAVRWGSGGRDLFCFFSQRCFNLLYSRGSNIAQTREGSDEVERRRAEPAPRKTRGGPEKRL